MEVEAVTELEPAKGIEPPTYGLQNHCSTIELHRRENAPDYTENQVALSNSGHFIFSFAALPPSQACRRQPRGADRRSAATTRLDTLTWEGRKA